MPSHLEVVAVAGTSAGALVAALVAKGYRGKQLKDILSDPGLRTLLNDADVERWKRLAAAFKGAQSILEKLQGKVGFSNLLKIRKWKNSHPEVVEDIKVLWQNRGVHQTDKLRTWLDRYLEDLTFEGAEKLGHVRSLRIVASDVSGRRFRVFGQNPGDGGLRVAKAVHASISIPLFFVPVVDDQDILVDGGMLSNFPSFLFVRSEYPTIGFRLLDVTPPDRIGSTLDFLRSLLHTMTEAHDRLRSLPDNFTSYEINVPDDIPGTKFTLDEADIDRLYQRGLAVGRTVEWDKYSSATKVIPYWDPKPQQALQLCITEANKLFNRFADPVFWVDKLVHKAVFTVKIKLDWSTSYERKGIIEVFGSRPLFVGRSTIHEVDSFAETSIADVVHEYKEVTAAGETDVIHVPAENAQEKKGFLLFYVPPITAGSPRTFRTQFDIKRELAETVAKDRSTVFSYGVRQMATDHKLELVFRLLVDTELDKLALSPDFTAQLRQPGTEFDAGENRTYHVNEWTLATQVNYNVSFEVTVEKARI